MFTPDFDGIVAAIWAKAEAATGTTRRCHYMPQFLTRRWAVDGMLIVEDLATRAVTYRPTKKKTGKPAFIDIGYEIDLYTTFDGEKVDRAILEELFGQLESETAETVTRLEKKDWLLSDQDRVTLSLFVAAMVLRLPPVLRAVETEYQPDFENVSPGAKQTPGNTTHALLNDLLKKMAESFYRKHRWTIVRYPDGRQHTGDIPLIIATRGDGAVSTNYDDWELRMPLDPHALLVTNGMAAPNQPLPHGTLTGTAPNEWNAPDLKVRIR